MRTLGLMVAMWAAGALGCGGSGARADAASGNGDVGYVCIGQAYDPCNDANGCPLVPNAVCRPRGSGADTVCTVACTAGGPACPTNSVGETGICTNGFCDADQGACTARP